ncbi:MAG: hypothetical protein AVDCRST_MAG76-91 [uncultured Acidimicrobiales bacterium]|uniref:Uncharacterized protein n=1 Tax=uncultured Acidimicrobiales bacterium TaxID=310071 RepID=A0A6J4H1G6_9ACTN|nr:MAG: hypothetical protein AVDCRST_MAG76-91 [uncultured Acidimicrobiales bacterium]
MPTLEHPILARLLDVCSGAQQGAGNHEASHGVRALFALAAGCSEDDRSWWT